MKHLNKLSNWFLILIIVIMSDYDVNAQTFTIIGRLSPKSTLKSITLKKYNSMTQQDYVAEIIIKNSSFEYKKQISEIDVYLLENKINNQFFIFIWDGNVEIEIDDTDLYKSKVYNSPLTTELRQQDSIRYQQVISPIRKLDTLLHNYQRDLTKKPSQIDSLKLLRNQQFDKSQIDLSNFTNNFIKKNPNSFISLFWLTQNGKEVFSEERLKEYNKLSNELKRHSRAEKMRSRFDFN